MSLMEKAKLARQPDWYAFLLPALGGLGVVLGGRRDRWAARRG